MSKRELAVNAIQITNAIWLRSRESPDTTLDLFGEER